MESKNKQLWRQMWGEMTDGRGWCSESVALAAGVVRFFFCWFETVLWCVNLKDLSCRAGMSIQCNSINYVRWPNNKYPCCAYEVLLDFFKITVTLKTTYIFHEPLVWDRKVNFRHQPAGSHRSSAILVFSFWNDTQGELSNDDKAPAISNVVA